MTNLTYNDTIASFGIFLDTVSARCAEVVAHVFGFVVHSPILIGMVIATICILIDMLVTARMERDPAYAKQVYERLRRLHRA